MWLFSRTTRCIQPLRLCRRVQRLSRLMLCSSLSLLLTCMADKHGCPNCEQPLVREISPLARSRSGDIENQCRTQLGSARQLFTWHAGKRVPLVLMSNGVSDRQFMLETCQVPPALLVECVITAMAWHVPIPGERWTKVPVMRPILRHSTAIASGASTPPDMSNYRHHPVAYTLNGSMPFAGVKEAVDPIVGCLTEGGLPATHAPPWRMDLFSAIVSNALPLNMSAQALKWYLSS